MKKLILGFIATFIMLTTQAQDSSKLTVKAVYEDVKAGITQLASKLEGPAKHVYEVYVYQHRAEALAFLLLILVLAPIGIILLIKHWKKADFGETTYKEATTDSCVPAVAGWMLCLASLVLTIIFFADVFFTKLINPEYYAIKDVINAFK